MMKLTSLEPTSDIVVSVCYVHWASHEYILSA